MAFYRDIIGYPFIPLHIFIHLSIQDVDTAAATTTTTAK